MQKDPVEQTEEFKKIVEVVDTEVKNKLATQGVVKTRGYIHQFWNLKQKLLKEKYGIEWKTPKEMNPNAFFD